MSDELATQHHSNIKRIIFWATLGAGVTAAYLMHKRGVAPGQIVYKTVTNPIGSLVGEIEQATA